MVVPSFTSSFPFPELSFLAVQHHDQRPTGTPLVNLPLIEKKTEMNPKTNTSEEITLKPFRSNSARFPIIAPKFMEPTKVKTDNSLTYKNVPAGWIAMLSRRLNEDQPSGHADTELQTAPPAIKSSSSSCSFLAGSFTSTEGICSKYGACRVDKLQYRKHVRICDYLS
jgi:hypothetical protein